jgi:hypothetical protein
VTARPHIRVLTGEQRAPAGKVSADHWPGWIGNEDVCFTVADGTGDGGAHQLPRVSWNPPGPADKLAGAEPLVELGGQYRRVHDRNRHDRTGQLKPFDLGENVEPCPAGGVAAQPAEEPQRRG